MHTIHISDKYFPQCPDTSCIFQFSLATIRGNSKQIHLTCVFVYLPARNLQTFEMTQFNRLLPAFESFAIRVFGESHALIILISTHV